MYRTIADFERQWDHERETSLKILKALTPEALGQAVANDHRTIGRIAWHLVQTMPEMLNQTGLKVTGPHWDTPVPTTLAEIIAGYEASANSVLDEVKSKWTDETLLLEDDMYGERWTRGFTLMALTHHEAHHRGQISVLMRQAGLKVPGIYGPSNEEWAAIGMAAPAV
ncbi:MAG: DinB family protein [Blastocatellia bacterium]|nr:DinB family protein [Blastocatellia bacterium]